MGHAVATPTTHIAGKAARVHDIGCEGLIVSDGRKFGIINHHLCAFDSIREIYTRCLPFSKSKHGHRK